MATMREHMTSVHQAEAAHHNECADAFAKAAHHLDKLRHGDDNMTDETAQHYIGLSNALSKAQGSHRQAAEFHEKCAKSLVDGTSEKIAKRGDEVEPTRVQLFGTDFSRVRAVPRAGQQPIADPAAGVDPAFAKMVSVQLDEEER